MSTLDEVALKVLKDMDEKTVRLPPGWSEFARRLTVELSNQEPVAEVVKPNEGIPAYVRWIGAFPCVAVGTKLYAGPVIKVGAGETAIQEDWTK